jgi:hypothetical protein
VAASRGEECELTMSGIKVSAQMPEVVDRDGLGIIGFIYAMIAVLVVMISGVLVHAHVVGQLTFEETNTQGVAQSVIKLVR